MIARASVVTGAFGYTGRYIARRLLERGETVVTLTGDPTRASEFGGSVRAFPFRFDNPEAMAESIAGARVLYNTYWVRFDRGGATHERAVANTAALLRAARLAGVERIVHISITNPSPGSPLPYFRGKALLEQAVRESGISSAILRPTVIFGREDILINNVAYLLQKLPVFLIPGSGRYRLQPIYAEDLARLAVEAAEGTDDIVMDAVGPETFSFLELVQLIARVLGRRSAIVHAPPGLALLAAHAMGAVLGDVLLTRDELDGLMASLLVSAAPPTGSTRLSEWLSANAATLGQSYASELRRHYSRRVPG